VNVIKIGYHDYLVPDSVDAGKLLSMLSKLEPCNEYLHSGKIYIQSEDTPDPMIRPLELGLKPVPAKTKFVVRCAEDEIAVDVSQKTGKRAERPAPKPKRPALAARSERLLLGGPRR
jgi:hypothetical protein